MKNISVLLFIFFSSLAVNSAEHPSLFITQEEAVEIRNSLNTYPVFKKSYEIAKDYVDNTLLQKIEIPPQGEAGGYEHEKHKQNYRDMKAAGVLFTLTGDFGAQIESLKSILSTSEEGLKGIEELELGLVNFILQKHEISK